MLIISIILFISAALLGLFILTAILNNQATPKQAVYAHGPLAAIALIILIIYSAMGHTEPLLITSIVLFILAALGGLTMFALDMKKKPVPKAVAVIHPIVAVIALLILIVYLFS